ncbi:MAG: acyl-CoA dehydratase activase [Eubacterium sp.]|nr:acyl-CoA dehydratase activase [Eubacterium sp.]
MYYTGIDIGSSSAKTVVTDENGTILEYFYMPTGWSSIEASERIKEELERKKYNISECRCTATGYGRISVPYADKKVTEITCHGIGAYNLFKKENMAVIDIGGQDTKAIYVKAGKVTDFIMNDKCSAGTGRFLEVMSNALNMSLDKLCEEARGGNGVKISSMCTVFAESEIISLIGRGEERKNIACAIVDSIAEKVVALAKNIVSGADDIVLTGGLCECDFLRETLSDKIGKTVISTPYARYAGAYGAAIKSLEDNQ